jgi:hypothetical protein
MSPRQLRCCPGPLKVALRRFRRGALEKEQKRGETLTVTVDYYVVVEHAGLGFRTVEERELAPNAIVIDDSTGQTYVVIRAKVLKTYPEPFSGVRFGRATARPTT